MVPTTSTLGFGIVIQVRLSRELLVSNPVEWEITHHLCKAIATVLFASADETLANVPVLKGVTLFDSRRNILASHGFQRCVSIIVLIYCPNQQSTKAKLVGKVNFLLKCLF